MTAASTASRNPAILQLLSAFRATSPAAVLELRALLAATEDEFCDEAARLDEAALAEDAELAEEAALDVDAALEDAARLLDAMLLDAVLLPAPALPPSPPPPQAAISRHIAVLLSPVSHRDVFEFQCIDLMLLPLNCRCLVWASFYPVRSRSAPCFVRQRRPLRALGWLANGAGGRNSPICTRVKSTMIKSHIKAAARRLNEEMRMAMETLSKLAGGMLHYCYSLDEETSRVLETHVLAEVPVPYKLRFRDQIQDQNWIIEYGRTLPVPPFKADFVICTADAAI